MSWHSIKLIDTVTNRQVPLKLRFNGIFYYVNSKDYKIALNKLEQLSEWVISEVPFFVLKDRKVLFFVNY